MGIINEIKSILDLMPTSYGMVVNNLIDNKVNIFGITSLSELISKTHKLSSKEQNYLLYRWFIYNTSKLDEELFALCDNVETNENKFSKDYDFKISGIPFDLKSTKISEHFRVNYDRLLSKPKVLIESFYEQQSQEQRYGFQNRIFIVYLSDLTPDNINHLRVNYEIKSAAIADYCVRFNEEELIEIGDLKSDIIFIREDELGEVTYTIASRYGSNTK